MQFGHVALPRVWFNRAVAPAGWDGLLRACGVVALAGIGLSTLVPSAADLAVLASLTLLTNGPYSIFLPVSLEPMLMVFSKLYPPLLVALVATTAQTAVEWVNLRLYGAALGARLFEGLRTSRMTRAVLRSFQRAPFITVAFCAMTPIPFWMARVTAALTGYPMPRHLAATAVGRFPRNWFYAVIGLVLPFSNGQILATGLTLTVVCSTFVVARYHLARRCDPVGSPGAP